MPFNPFLDPLRRFFPLHVLHLGLFICRRVMVSLVDGHHSLVPQLLRLTTFLLFQGSDDGRGVFCVRGIE